MIAAPSDATPQHLEDIASPLTPGTPLRQPPDERGGLWPIRGGIALTIAILALGLGCTYQVRSFSVSPPLACPGERVAVQWEVAGPARLRAERSKADWDEGEVPSSGSRTVVPQVTTTFIVTAVNANLAKGGSSGSKQVEVATNGPRMVSATCDSGGSCKGTFELVTAATGGPSVQLISAPTAIGGGTERDVEICVSSPSLQRTCVPPGGTATVSVPANGTWTLEASLPDFAAPAPPPNLRVGVAFRCP